MQLDAPHRVQLAWPFAALGAAAGSQLPAGLAGGLTLALLFGFLGALVSTGIERVRDWQVALLAPLVGALSGAMLGFLLDGLDGSAASVIAGTGFGLLALPPLVLITDGARRASRLGPRSLVGRAQRRRMWLLTLAAGALAALIVPALANPGAQPARSPLAQAYALGAMIVAMADSALWIGAAAPRPERQDHGARHPYREPGLPTALRSGQSHLPQLEEHAVGVLAAQALLYDAVLVAVVAAALLVSA